MADRMMDGDTVGKPSNNPLMPPVDTGESIGLGASKLTITFGISKSLMKKIGLSSKIPDAFKDLPHFPNDQLIDDYSDGDIMIQACSNDSQVSFHAVHNLVRPFRDIVKVRWAQSGFISAKGKETPRNLMAFKDGTINPRKSNQLKDYVFIDDGWAKHGTYCVVRRIQIHIETWDRTALEEQEATFGRKRHSGAPLTGGKEFDEIDLKAKDSHGEYIIDKDAHTRLAKEANTSILRRAFNYVDGTDDRTGNFETGLLFIAFQKATQQFIDIQNNLGSNDKLNEYITHRGSASFLVLPGVSKEDTLVKHYLTKIIATIITLVMVFSFGLLKSQAAEQQSISDVYSVITDAKSALSNNSISKDNKLKAIEQVVSAVKKLSLEDNSEGNAVKSNVRKLEDAKANDDQKIHFRN